MLFCSRREVADYPRYRFQRSQKEGAINVSTPEAREGEDRYRIEAELARGIDTRVMRGWRRSDGERVILKLLTQDPVQPDRLARFRREYELTARLPETAVVTPLALDSLAGAPAIVMPDQGFTSLDRALEAGPFEPAEATALALAATRALAEIHKAGVIHKEIAPGHILYEPTSGAARLIGFGRATELDREHPEAAPVTALTGALPYLAPEQTGRLNRGIDYRCDFYGLGATLMALLTGQPPFTESDPLTLVHCHLAVAPPPPSAREPDVPTALDGIVARLLAKNAESRYQSVGALAHDLETCGAALAAGEAIPAFTPGAVDIPLTLQMPQQLYGREGQLAELQAGFDHASAGARALALVAGEPGIGKSALVKALYPAITGRGGLFLAGKFEQLGAERPYTGLVTALESLVEQLLGEPDAALRAWQERLTAALEGNGGVLARLVPAIERLLGPQPRPVERNAQAERNRLTRTLKNFLGAVAGPESPVVLFLDDVQWADQATLELLAGLLGADDVDHLCIIVAYRDAAIGQAHPLHRLPKQAEAVGATVTNCHVGGLTQEDVAQLIADALYTTPESVADLAQQAYSKTLGNPFFLERLLGRWAEAGLLWPDSAAGYWRWDLAGIANTASAENVVALMQEKLAELPEATQAMLARAAVMGGEVDLAQLAVVAETTPRALLDTLWPALKAEILLPVDDGYKFMADADQGGRVRFRFRHDKVQQAAVDRLDAAARRAVDASVGRLLCAHIEDPAEDSRLFQALRLLNAVEADIADSDERQRLARLNCIAARRASRAVATDQAMTFVESGLAFLGSAGKEWDYATWLALHNLGAEAAALLRNTERLNALATAVIEGARQRADTVDVREIRIRACMAAETPGAAMNEGLAALRDFGYRLPARPSKLRAQATLARIRPVLNRCSPEDQTAVGELVDPEAIAVGRLLISLLVPAFHAGSWLFAIATCHAVVLFWRHGNHPASAKAFADMATVLVALGGSLDEARRFTRLAEAIIARYPESPYQDYTRLTILNMVEAWYQDPADHMDQLRKAAHRAQANGDFFSAVLQAAAVNFLMWATGGPVAQRTAEIVTNRAFMSRLAPVNSPASASILSLLENMAQPAPAPTHLHRLETGEQGEADMLLRIGHTISLRVMAAVKLEACFQFRESAEIPGWLAYFRQRETISFFTIAGLRADCVEIWADAFGVSDSPGVTWRDRVRLQRLLGRLERRFRKIPYGQPYAAWVALARAEVSWVKNRPLEALRHDDAAVGHADARDQKDIAGLARERAADRLQASGSPQLARAYLGEAAQVYAAMGARGKLADLEARYGVVVPVDADSAVSSQAPATTLGQASTASRLGGLSQGGLDLDLDAVIRAAETISQEIRPESLVESLMRTVSHTAGATHGCLLLGTSEAGLRAQARLDVEAVPEIAVLNDRPFADGAATVPVAPAVLRYVLRTRETLVLDEPTTHRSYGRDPYLQQVGPRALMAVPLVNQGRLAGILYLEHRHSPGAFPESRVNVLSLLSAQMAISLENAQLYAAMEEQVAQRTQELEAEKAETERAHRVIQDSLETARQMQRAALPDVTAAELGLSDLAIWWEPRDQVGGDFYRLEATRDGRYVAVVLMDCTGHGVPGALISFIASSAADRALAESLHWSPSALLEALDRMVRNELHGRGVSRTLDDGLEAGILVLDTHTGAATYAGVGINLFRLGPGEPEIVRGLKGGLGYNDLAPPKRIPDQAVNASDGETLVLATDGILEQVGGAKRLQLGRRRFAQMLANSHGPGPLGAWLESVQAAFAGWRGSEPLRDDVTVLAFRAR